MDTRWIVVFAGLVVLALASEKVRYDNYRVFRVFPTTQDHVDMIQKLETTFGGVSFWKDPSYPNRPVDIMVVPHKIGEFQALMRERGITSETLVENVQTLFDNVAPANRASAAMGWDDFYPLEVINAWLDSLVSANPGVVSPIVAGSTFEGRQIRGAKVSYKAGNPAVFVEAGMHAREWTGPASVTYFLNQLLTSTDTTVRTIAENLDWYIVPSANPDGYVYSWTTDRQWRKTRSKGVNCWGVDPNRNWDYRWMEESSSANECADTYAGPKAFSEIETRSLADYVTKLSINSSLVGYFVFHSYSQLLMYPYGSNKDKADNEAELDTLVRKAVQSLARRYGTNYRYGPIHNTIYPATGTSLDWVKKSLNVRFVYVWELGQSFGPPVKDIIKIAEETMDSVVSIAQDILALL